jgi:peptide/histidine transporter 3/4
MRKLEGYVDWKKWPVDKSRHGRLRVVVFVLVAEVFENLAFLANASNLVTYFNQYMHFTLAKSAITVTNFMGTSFLLPLLGGYWSDAFMPTFVKVISFAGIELADLYF